MEISGVWLPIVTPFYGQSVDYDSYRNLIDYYISKKVAGIIPLGTTGEVSTIEDTEYEEIIALTTEYVNHRAPILIGCGGNCTSKVVKQIRIVDKYDVQGILSVSPYYNRPESKMGFSNIFYDCRKARIWESYSIIFPIERVEILKMKQFTN